MSWRKVAGLVANAAPMLGTILGGPPGAALGAVVPMIASALGVKPEPTAIEHALKSDPDALTKIRQLEIESNTEIRLMVIQAGVSEQREYNKTLQQDSASEHTLTQIWRPVTGLAFAGCMVVVVLGLMIALGIAVFAGNAEMIASMVALGYALAALFGTTFLPVLGVTAYHRGKMQRAKVGDFSVGKGLGATIKDMLGR